MVKYAAECREVVLQLKGFLFLLGKEKFFAPQNRSKKSYSS